MEGLGVWFAEGTWHLLEREVHGLAVLPCQSNHFISAGRRTAYAETRIALGHQPTSNRMEDFVEDWIADTR